MPSSIAANTWRVLLSLGFLDILNITIRTYRYMFKPFPTPLHRNLSRTPPDYDRLI